MARPTKYSEALLDKCVYYMQEYKEIGDTLPSHVGLFIYVGISKTCAYDWAKEEDKKEFSDILDQILIMQERELINRGITGEFNANITKLVLGKHGYSDKQDTSLTGKDGKDLIPTAIQIIHE